MYFVYICISYLFSSAIILTFLRTYLKLKREWCARLSCGATHCSIFLYADCCFILYADDDFYMHRLTEANSWLAWQFNVKVWHFMAHTHTHAHKAYFYCYSRIYLLDIPTEYMGVPRKLSFKFFCVCFPFSLQQSKILR